MKITTKQLALEQQLNGRLRMMGLILLFCAAAAIIWDFLPSAENELDQLILEIEEAPPPLNSYFVSSVFATIGSSCLLIYWKKKKVLSSQTPPEQ